MRHRDNEVLEEGHLQNGCCGPDTEGLTLSCPLALHEAPRGSPSSKRRQRRSALAQDRRAGKGQVGASLQSLSKRDPPTLRSWPGTRSKNVWLSCGWPLVLTACRRHHPKVVPETPSSQS